MRLFRWLFIVGLTMAAVTSAIGVLASWLMPDFEDRLSVEADRKTIRQYVVQPGDTLSSIAAEHGKTVNYLVRRNELESAELIVVGQTLQLEGAAHPRPQRTVPIAQPRTATQATQALMDCVRRNGASTDTCQEEREAWSKLTLEEDEARVHSRQTEDRRRKEQAKRLSRAQSPRSKGPSQAEIDRRVKQYQRFMACSSRVSVLTPPSQQKACFDIGKDVYDWFLWNKREGYGHVQARMKALGWWRGLGPRYRPLG